MTKPRSDRLAFLAALLLCIIAAVVQFAQFVPRSNELWTDAIHDRNAHYHLGLSLALDVRNGDVVNLVNDVNSARVWPPLHGILLSGVLTLGGFDVRLAVLPSLCAWAGLLMAVFVLARRLAPTSGNVAGFAALLLTLASPAHRAFATEVMLESLGACLSLWAIERAVAFRQAPSVGTGRSFGILLTLLFLTKFNYWVLVVGGVVATEVVAQGHDLWLWLQANGVALVRWLGHPLMLLAALAGIGALVLNAYAPFTMGPVKVPHGGELGTLMVALVLARIWLWRYRGDGRTIWPGLPAEVRALVLTGVLPVAIWFALPGRLAAFLWFGLVSPGEIPDPSLVSRAGKILGWMNGEYHLRPELFEGVVLLALLAVVARPSGVLVVVLFLALAVALTVKHPNCKARFLMNWMPALWVLAGVGLATLARWRLALPGLAALAVVCVPWGLRPGQTQEAGLRPGASSLMPLAEAFVPHISRGERTAVFATVPMKYFTQWSLLQSLKPRRDRELEGRGWLPLEAANLDGFVAWLDRARCEKLVVIELDQESPFGGSPPGWSGDLILKQWKATQHQFEQAARVAVPESGAVVVVYRRTTGVPIALRE